MRMSSRAINGSIYKSICQHEEGQDGNDFYMVGHFVDEVSTSNESSTATRMIIAMLPSS